MSKINSLKELEKIKKTGAKKIEKRLSEKGTGNKEILFGMATCGIAAGAQEVYDAIVNEINNNNEKNIELVKVGCIGHCYAEPIIQVNIPGSEPVLYGNVDGETAIKIFKEHVLGGKILKDIKLEKGFVRA